LLLHVNFVTVGAFRLLDTKVAIIETMAAHIIDFAANRLGPIVSQCIYSSSFIGSAHKSVDQSRRVSGSIEFTISDSSRVKCLSGLNSSGSRYFSSSRLISLQLGVFRLETKRRSPHVPLITTHAPANTSEIIAEFD
jgi:hypothetical protein